MHRREAKYKQEAKQLNWYRSSSTEEQYENKQDQAKTMINQDETTNKTWTTFLEKAECQISNIITEEEELIYTYRNYIYRGKNWKCLICDAENHCEHYYCILC